MKKIKTLATNVCVVLVRSIMFIAGFGIFLPIYSVILFVAGLVTSNTDKAIVGSKILAKFMFNLIFMEELSEDEVDRLHNEAIEEIERI